MLPADTRRRGAELALAAFALVVTAPGFGNRFVQDELSLILRNERVHTLARPAGFFTTPYWHDPFPPALYRPLATATLALQWKAGGGAPTIYRLVSAALLAGTAIALFHLAALLLPVAAAAALSALFVVHPVHVEAVALGVNQGELAVGLLLCWATAWYIRARRRGRLRPGDVVGILALYIIAGWFKESGVILPGLLIAAELTVIENSGGHRDRVARLRPFYLLLGLAFALLVAVRSLVLAGDVVGTFTAPSMIGAGPAGRALTMLGVVPHWGRLLFWPAELQADYGPQEIVAATGWGPAQWTGLAMLVVGGVVLVATRRRVPVLAFGLSWMAVALLPVSNVVVPTGITLAERTLFLASAGAALLVGALLAAVGPRGTRPALRAAMVALVGLLLVLGVWRSQARIKVWHDQATLLHQTVADAPKSFGAQLSLVRFLEDSGSATAAASHYREAARLNPGQLTQDRTLGDLYRTAGFCRPAVRLYRRVLSVVPEDAEALGSLRTCLQELADSALLRQRR